MNVFSVLGHNVKKLRQSLKWSQEELAFQAGISDRGDVSHIERELGNPTLETLEGLAKALNVSVSDLLSANGLPENIVLAPVKPRPIKAK